MSAMIGIIPQRAPMRPRRRWIDRKIDRRDGDSHGYRGRCRDRGRHPRFYVRRNPPLRVVAETAERESNEAFETMQRGCLQIIEEM